MPVDNATTTAELVDLGRRLDRAPQAPAPGDGAVAFGGRPEIEVRLGGDEDAVTVGTNVTLDVKREHTLAVAEALLTTRGVYLRQQGGVRKVLGTIARALGSAWDAELVVEVPGATYTQGVPFPREGFYAWLAALPVRRP